MTCKLASLLLVGAFVGFLNSTPRVLSQQSDTSPQTVTLVARRTVDGYDNYAKAAFSFKYGVNGDEARDLTHNNWDVLFGNNPDLDLFEVTMVVDDCSRIKDLGEHSWYDYFAVPALDAYEKPTREPAVSAVEGHMYLVHSKDRDDSHYALFRVESLQPLKSVTISWKLIPAPTPTSN